MAAAAILENRKIAIYRPRFDRFWPNLARRRISAILSAPTVKILFQKLKNPRWRRRLSWKIEKSPYLGRVSTDFDQIWQGDAFQTCSAVRPLKIWNLKNLRWRRPPSWKIEKSPYLGNDTIYFDQIWHGDTFWPFEAADRWKFGILKTQDGGDRHLEKSKNRHISTAFWPVYTNNQKPVFT